MQLCHFRSKIRQDLKTILFQVRSSNSEEKHLTLWEFLYDSNRKELTKLHKRFRIGPKRQVDLVPPISFFSVWKKNSEVKASEMFFSPKFLNLFVKPNSNSDISLKRWFLHDVIVYICVKVFHLSWNIRIGNCFFRKSFVFVYISISL